MSYPWGARVHVLPLQQAATGVAGLLRARAALRRHMPTRCTDVRGSFGLRRCQPQVELGLKKLGRVLPSQPLATCMACLLRVHCSLTVPYACLVHSLEGSHGAVELKLSLPCES